jgi:perosamine synthetase
VGLVSALSFNGNKVVTTGGGGAVLTNDAALARRAKHLTTTARIHDRWNFVHDEVGYNFRLPNLNAALGCAQLERLPSMIERKRELAQRYIARFAEVEGVRFVREPEGTRSNYWLNSVMLERPDQSLRDELLTALNKANYMSRPVWTLMPKLPMYAQCPRMELSVSAQIEDSLVNVPSSARLGR